MAIGRPRSFKTEEAVSAATSVFWEKGYESTSLPDLLDAMTLSKSSFYQTFGSKQALFKKCVEHYCAVASQEMLTQLDEAPDAHSFLEDLFLGVASTAGRPPSKLGCLLMNSVTEFGAQDNDMATFLQSGVDQFRKVFRTAVRLGQRDGTISNNISPSTLSNYLVASFTGLRTLLKSGVSAREAKRIAEVMLEAL